MAKADLLARLGSGVRNAYPSGKPVIGHVNEFGAAALVLIAEELRTANLIAAAALIPSAREDDELRLTLRDEIFARIGYAPPSRPGDYDPLDSIG